MLVPIQWLRDYIELDYDIDTFCEKMIMSGSNLEAIETFGEGIENVVVGKIMQLEKHPDADKLLVCQLDVGKTDPVQIVTGATNVFEGALVPVALHNSKIPGPLHGQPKQEGGVKITKGKLRGIESFGMLCSASELGFEDKVISTVHREGIWILSDDFSIGQDICEALELKQSVVDFEITPNRPDCLSMLGMAREAAATFKQAFHYPDMQCEKEEGNVNDYIGVEIRRQDLCKRYIARIVKDVKIGQSPWWLQKRLMLAGMRPINNIVDITNFVMLEYGAPIHAFDIRQVEGNKIVVDTAEQGEIFTTLDGTERKLDGDMLLIKDSKKGIAIAGVMGGLNSEIEADTETIVIEAANFSGDSTRSTSKKLGLRTEASARFEKGIDPNLCEAAANRVCKLIEQLSCGKVIQGAVDIYPEPVKPHSVNVRVSRVNDVLGINLERREMEAIFENLEMDVSGEGNVIQVTPPTVRRDLVEEIDFVEEIARIYGYDRMPMTIPKGNPEAKKTRERSLKDLAKNAMCAMGVNEIQTYSFVSPKGVDNIRIDEDAWERNFVRLINPLGEENSVMRTILTPNILEVLGRNYSRNIQSVKAFELGNTFTANMIDPEELPDEQDSMVVAFYGKGEDFFTLKGTIVELLTNLGITDVQFVAESKYGVYHPGRCARIKTGDAELGIMGEIYPDVAEKYGIGTRCYCCELRFDMVMDKADIEKSYKPLPRYPAASRDIALLVDEEVKVGDIKEIIRKECGVILEGIELFDVYRGKQVSEGKKSVAFALTYRAADKTLTEEDVAKVHEPMLLALKEKVNAVLREM